jgi:hypothetical protein
MPKQRHPQQQFSSRKATSQAVATSSATFSAWAASSFSAMRCAWNPFLVSLVANLMLFAFTYLFYKPQFNTRDDTILMLLAAGKIIALAPTEYLIHTNIILGIALQWLYTSFAGVSWYALYLIAALFVAHVALLWAALKQSRSWLAVAVFVLYFALHGAYILLSLQYTMAAMMLGFAGMLLLAVAKNGDRAGWQGFMSAASLTGALLLLVAWMIRWKSCALAVAVCSPLLIIHTAHQIFGQRNWRPLAAQGVGVLLALILCSAAHSFNASKYATWGAGDCLEFNALREVLQDERPLQRTAMTYEQKRDAMRRVGWSEFDLEMFYNDFFMNDTLYNTRTFHAFIADLADKEHNADAVRVWQQRDYIHSHLWERERDTLLGWPARGAICFFLLGCALMFSFTRKNIVPVLQAASLLLAVIAASVYVHNHALMRDAPERVLLPLFAVLWSVPFVCSTRLDEIKFSSTASISLRVMLLVVPVANIFLPSANSISPFTRYAAISHSVEDGEREWHEHLSMLQPSNGKLYVIWGNGFPMGSIAPFQRLDDDAVKNFHALWLSWCERTPTSRAMLDRYGVRDLYWDIATKDSIFVLLSLNQVREKTMMYQLRYEKYLNEHYKASVKGRNDAFRALTRWPVGATPDPLHTFFEAQFRLQTTQYQDSTLIK